MGGTNSSQKDFKSSEFEEPQIYLQKRLFSNYLIQILFSKHMKFEFDTLVVPTNSLLHEIESLNRYLTIGIRSDIMEYILHKTDLDTQSIFEIY